MSSYRGAHLGKRCAVERTLRVIGGRWKVLIIRELIDKTLRFGELHRELGGVTQKVLTQQLRELEADGILKREIYPEIPPKVEYSLSPLGESLWTVLIAMHDWGETNAQHLPEQDLA